MHDAHSAYTRLPAVSRSVTRSPSVSTGVQVLPPVWVTNRPGPNAHPSVRSRNLIWPTPVAPSGAPVSGAGTPDQVLPASSVRATEVQYCVAQWPGVPAWPITQPVWEPTKVTEVGRKSGGTGGIRLALLAAVDGAALLGRRAGVAEVECPAPATGPDVGFSPSIGRLTTCGTVTAAATSTAAVLAVMASLRYLRRRARRLIRSNVPGGGGSGSIRSFSQASTSSWGPRPS